MYGSGHSFVLCVCVCVCLIIDLDAVLFCSLFASFSLPSTPLRLSAVCRASGQLIFTTGFVFAVFLTRCLFDFAAGACMIFAFEMDCMHKRALRIALLPKFDAFYLRVHVLT